MPDADKIDENLDMIHKGQAARMIRGQVEGTIIDKEEDIINDLVRLYHADTLTNEKLRGSIGEIAGLRAFREKLETDIRVGTAAAEVELGQDGN